MDKSFVPFYWDTLRGFGIVQTKADWDKFVRKHYCDMKRIKGFKNDMYSEGQACFGEGIRFTKRPVLGDWMKQNNPGIIPE